MLEETQDTEELIERVAALDIGKKELVCCVRVPGEGKGGRRLQEVRTYTTMTRSLLVLADRLGELGVTRVVMEATSDYWKAPFYLLEAQGFEVWLVNAKDVKHLPGRPKTDRLDAVWLAKLTERGMLRPSFVPPAEIRRLRDYTRLRADLTQERARHYQRLEKLLEDALIKVSSVASKLDGLSVRDMLEALIAGERDPAVLAGRFDDHHAELARMLLDQIDALGGQIGTLTTRIEELLAAIPAAHGVDPTAPPARVLAAAQTRWCCPRWRGWMRSAASGPAPPRSSSPRSGWTWMSSRLLGIWCRGPS